MFHKSPKENIPKNYPELEIQNSRPYQITVMGGNFKFPVQDSFSEYFFGSLGDLRNESHFLKKKPALTKSDSVLIKLTPLIVNGVEKLRNDLPQGFLFRFSAGIQYLIIIILLYFPYTLQFNLC